MSNIVLARLGENIKASTAGQVATSSGSTTAPALVDNTFSFRNKIINGNFDIWQRGTSMSPGVSDQYLSDRWKYSRVGSTFTASQQTFTIGQTNVPGEPIYFHRAIVTTVAGNSNYVYLLQHLENVRTFAGKTVTLSFYAKADSNKPISIEFSQSFGSGGSPSSSVTGIGVQKLNLTTSWQKFTVTANIPSIVGKGIGTNNNHCLDVIFWFDAGSNFNSRTDSLGQQSGTFDIAQVQLEEGSFATTFEQRPIGTELALCQRYYQFYDGDVSLAGATSTGSNMLVTTFLPVKMRQAPVINAASIVSSQAQGVSITAAGANDRFFIQGRSNTPSPVGGTYGVFSFAYNDVSFNAEL